MSWVLKNQAFTRPLDNLTEWNKQGGLGTRCEMEIRKQHTCMGVEIERKYLLANSDWQEHVDTSVHIQQGYLCSDKERTVRIRVSDGKAWITVKGISVGMSRTEFEYEIPLADGSDMIHLCEKPTIDKTRHIVRMGDLKWEIDEFEGANTGLIVAEIELSYEGEEFFRPSWIGEEVTDDIRYFNTSLMHNPFVNWSTE